MWLKQKFLYLQCATLISFHPVKKNRKTAPKLVWSLEFTLCVFCFVFVRDQNTERERDEFSPLCCPLQHRLLCIDWVWVGLDWGGGRMALRHHGSRSRGVRQVQRKKKKKEDSVSASACFSLSAQQKQMSEDIIQSNPIHPTQEDHQIFVLSI